jgi:hypothetical protein
MLTVACVLRPSKDFDGEYVTRLKAGVGEHLKMPHRFVCLSSVEVPCQRIPLMHNWPGWWSKVELFRLPPPVLYFDLDTMPVGDLGDIGAHALQSPFTTLRDFYRENGIGSGMMSWAADGVRQLYDTFAADPAMWQDRLRTRGDQAFIEENMMGGDRWQDVLPGQVVSYKAHVRAATRRGESGEGHAPNGSRVVCFHGKPKPRDIGWKI